MRPPSAPSRSRRRRRSASTDGERRCRERLQRTSSPGRWPRSQRARISPRSMQLRIRWLGKKGALTAALKSLGTLPAAERPAAGQRDQRGQRRPAERARGAARRASSAAGGSRARRRPHRCHSARARRGARAGCIRSRRRACGSRSSLRRAGFDVAVGPEIEDDFHNFEALNIPDNHPARAMHDTFYFTDGRLLRTHTSPVQIRAMLARGAPLAVIAPGRVYRCDSRRHPFADVPSARGPVRRTRMSASPI